MGGGGRHSHVCVRGGYGNGVDPGTCIQLLPDLEWLALKSLKAAWGGFDGRGTWKQSTPCERLNSVTCDATDNHIVGL
ncbi:hypothetical protein CLOM_g15066, partial [Closterium sp. NIES-68]